MIYLVRLASIALLKKHKAPGLFIAVIQIRKTMNHSFVSPPSVSIAISSKENKEAGKVEQ